MLNAFHSPQSIALIGATSEIGQSILRAIPHANLETCFVVARDPQQATDSLRQFLPSGTQLVNIDFEAKQTQTHREIVERLFQDGDLDIAIIAAGVLGNDPNLDVFSNALDVMNVNYVASAHLLLLIAEKMKMQGHGQIEVISSFAQTRPRVDNFIYGSSKAGLDFMARGLSERLKETGVSIHVLRPGFVRTRMTKLMTDAPFAIDKDAAGKIGAKLLKDGEPIGYAPPILKWVALVFKVLPANVFRKLSNRKS
ncbi:MAG TPA: SDR family NAD(P)-dependent oxidoreductase [Candidatus Nanopelagicaceae bacterium]